MLRHRGDDDDVPLLEAVGDEGGDTTRQSGWWGMRRRFIVVEPLIILYVSAALPVMIITQQWMFHKVAEEMGVVIAEGDGNDTCSTNKSDPNMIARNQVQEETTKWNTYIALVHFLPGLISPVVIGSLGDVLGRRFILILPIIGSILSNIVYLAVIIFDLRIYWLFLTGLEYCFGGFSVMFLGCFTYIADTVKPENRSFRMTFIDVVGIACGGISNLAMGYWIKSGQFRDPLLFTLAVKVACLLYAIFCVPETLKPLDPAEKEKRRESKLQLFLNGIYLCLYDNGQGRRWRINLLLTLYVISEIIQPREIMTLYEMNEPFCWGSVLISYYTSFTMIAQCIVTGGVAKTPLHIFPLEWRIVASKFSALAQAVFLAFATTNVMLFLSPVIGCISFLAIPIVRVILSTLVSPHEQGAAFSVMSGLQNMAILSSQMLSNKVYGWAITWFAGIYFFICAGIYSISFFLMLVYIFLNRAKGPLSIQADTEERIIDDSYDSRNDGNQDDEILVDERGVGSIQA